MRKLENKTSLPENLIKENNPIAKYTKELNMKLIFTNVDVLPQKSPYFEQTVHH